MNLAQIQQLQKTGNIRGFTVVNEKQVTPIPKSKPVEAEGLAHIKWVLQKRGIIYHEEHRFLKTRRFRFDLAVLHFRLFIEYEGLVSTGKKGGHQTRKGYTDNCQKYNLAAIEGWTGLRYTSLNYKYFESDLVNYLLNLKPTN